MGQIANALGLGAEITFKGQTYKVSPWNYRIQGEFELHLQRQAKETMKEMREYLTESEYRELVLEVQRDISSGHYSFGGEAVQKAMGTVPHMEYLLYLCLKKNHPDVKMELVKEIVAERLDEVMSAMSDANRDPNPKAPAGETPPAGA